MAATIPPTVLLTRPLPAARRFAGLIDAPCVISPLMAPDWLDPGPPPEAEAYIFTSATAVAGWTRLHSARGVAYCVGDRTAQVAREAGFQAQSAKGDVTSLAALLDTLPQQTLLHVRGTHVAGDLGARVKPYTVYEQRPRDLTPEATALLASNATVILPLFSPRSVALFAAQNSPLQARLVPVAISKAVGKGIAEAGLGTAMIADVPDAPGMARAIASALGSLA